MELKDTLHRYLRLERDALIWKLEGLGERQVRTPMTATGTNLLGLVRHATGVEAEYLGLVFDRPLPFVLGWDMDGEDNDDFWVPAEESTQDALDLYARVQQHADATIEALPLEAPGRVPWWGRPETPLGHVLVHVIGDLARHAGHADILREKLDGAVGMQEGNANMPTDDARWWADYRARLQGIADSFGG
jgi:hypothetical protein